MLLDLGFAEFDVLARDRIVLLLDQLVVHGARILLGDVVEAGVGRGHELDLDGDRFGHVLNLRKLGNLEPAKRPALAGNLARNRLMSRFYTLKTTQNGPIMPRRTGFWAAAGPD